MDLGGMFHRLRGDGRLCYRTYYAYYISAYNRSRLTESDALVESMNASSTQLQHRSTMSSSRAFESSFSGVMTSSLDVIEDPDDHIRQILDEAKRDLMKSIKSIQHTSV